MISSEMNFGENTIEHQRLGLYSVITFLVVYKIQFDSTCIFEHVVILVVSCQTLHPSGKDVLYMYICVHTFTRTAYCTPIAFIVRMKNHSTWVEKIPLCVVPR